MSQSWLKHYEADVPRTVDFPERNLASMLEETAQKYPRKAALWSAHGSLSYEGLLYNVQCFASVLKDLGVGPGDRVMLLLPNSLQLVVALYGALWAGATCVLTSPDFPIPMLRAQLRDSAPKLAVLPAPMPAGLEDELREDSPPNLIFCSGREYNRTLRGWLRVTASKLRAHPAAPAGGPRVLRWRQMMATARPMTHFHSVEGSRAALILYTGGTTGTPRGVELSHRALWANTLQLAAWDTKMEFGKERILGALPLFHSYGFTTSLSLAMRTGSTLILCETLDPESLMGYCHRFRPSLLPGVPALYSDLLTYARLRRAKLHSVRACISGASPLPIEVQEGFEKVTKGRLVEGYGLTEAGPVTHSNPLYGLRKPGSIGIPLPSTEARVLNLETGEEAADGEVGELVVRGPQIMNGYYGNPGETAKALKDGWLHTGDIVQRDADGYFYVISRRVDCVFLEGRTVYPRDIEEVVYQHPAIREVAVVGWPQPELFTELGFAVANGLRAFVSVRPERRISLEELQAFCRHHLPAALLPSEWKFLKQLPRTPFGKVSRRKLYDVPSDDPPAP